jgi:hypothetical protein
MIAAHVYGIGVAGPGLADWPGARDVLLQRAEYDATRRPTLKSNLLPATERRRSTEVIGLALHVGEQAIIHAGGDATDVRTVFASSGGDAMILHKICETLATPERMVSPTQFHNSVHNAAAGYWHIGTHSRAASTALSSYDDSFASGVLEALAWLAEDPAPVLLVAYDVPAPPPLLGARPLRAAFGVALLLGHDAARAHVASFDVRLLDAAPEATTLRNAALRELHDGNPAARALPLLEAVASADGGRVTLPYFADCGLEFTVRPCPT